MQELETWLSQTSFFGGLSEPLIALLAGMLKERRVAAGEQLFAEGDDGKSMYIVRSGALIVQRGCADGTQARLLMMRPGDHFGVTSLIEMERGAFSCKAEGGPGGEGLGNT